MHLIKKFGKAFVVACIVCLSCFTFAFAEEYPADLPPSPGSLGYEFIIRYSDGICYYFTTDFNSVVFTGNDFLYSTAEEDGSLFSYIYDPAEGFTWLMNNEYLGDISILSGFDLQQSGYEVIYSNFIIYNEDGSVFYDPNAGQEVASFYDALLAVGAFVLGCVMPITTAIMASPVLLLTMGILLIGAVCGIFFKRLMAGN